MAVEQCVYVQVVPLCRKDLKITEENKNKNEVKFKFQGQSARSQRWFNIDLDCIEEHFSTREPIFYKTIYKRHDETKDTNTFKMFVVQIVNTKNMEEIKFNIDAPMLKYRQSTLNSCCFSSLVSYFESTNQRKVENSISKCIE